MWQWTLIAAGCFQRHVPKKCQGLQYEAELVPSIRDGKLTSINPWACHSWAKMSLTNSISSYVNKLPASRLQYLQDLFTIWVWLAKYLLARELFLEKFSVWFICKAVATGIGLLKFKELCLVVLGHSGQLLESCHPKTWVPLLLSGLLSLSPIFVLIWLFL